MPDNPPTLFETQLLGRLQETVSGSCAARSALLDQYWDDLSAEEREPLTHAADKRRREFAAGRHAAKRCSERLGRTLHHLLIGDQRQPCWPDGIVGTISHDATSALAWLAPSHQVRGLGLDVERTERLRRRTWRLLFTPLELALLKNTEDSEMALTLFSAKESVYKCLFPTVNRFVGYKEVSVEPAQHTPLRCVTSEALAEESGVKELPVWTLRSPDRLATWTCLSR